MAERYQNERDGKYGRKSHNMGVPSFLRDRWKYAARDALNEQSATRQPRDWIQALAIAPRPTTLEPGQGQGSNVGHDVPDVSDAPDISDIPDEEVIPDLGTSGEARLLEALDCLMLEANACENQRCRLKDFRDRTAVFVSMSFGSSSLEASKTHSQRGHGLL